MILDGKRLAEKRLQELKIERAQFGGLTLSIVVLQEDAVTSSFLKIKNRTAEALGIAVKQTGTLASAVAADGVILQLPLPPDVDPEVARNKIPASKDVDVLSDAAYQKFVAGDYPAPPVARAMDYIMKSYDTRPTGSSGRISYEGKKVVVVGQGRLVGKPAAEMFRQKGALVTVLERGDDVKAHTLDADVIVLGAGVPHLLTPDMIKDGAVVLDAGTSESSGKVVGDADPACADKCALFTPTPGGIGPIAVLEIFANLFELKRHA